MRRADRLSLVRDQASGVEAVRGRFQGHAYDLHHHDEWLVGVTDHGLQDFYCRGARRRSTPGRVILIEPGEPHDGRAGTPEGFAYRMLYLPQAWLEAGLGPALGVGVPAGGLGFRATLQDDAELAAAIRRACGCLERESARLAREAALDGVLEALRPHLGLRPALAPGRSDAVAYRARERLHAGLDREIGADALAAQAGAADRFQLARAFRAVHGTSPHAYLVGLRLAEARRRLAAGEPPAGVAAACGFSDQSHLGRWFRRAYGVTPAGYRAGRTGVPDRTRHPP